MHTSAWPVFIKNSSAGKGFSPLAIDSEQIRNFYLVRYTISVCNIKTWFRSLEKMGSIYTARPGGTAEMPWAQVEFNYSVQQ